MTDLLVEYMKKHGIKPTRENYVALNTMGDESGADVLDAEQEADMPEELQHPEFKSGKGGE